MSFFVIVCLSVR